MTLCRLLIDSAVDGPTNMAVDDAILQTAEQAQILTLRIYRWSQPTLSLGYFQPFDQRQAHPASLTCPVVRRKSGGGAILHDHEITYALAIPMRFARSRLSPAAPAAAPIPEWLYAQVHAAWVSALLPITHAVRQFGPNCHEKSHDLPFLCFLRRSCWDLVIGQEKVLGSAQRKGKQAVLQHGSLLLRRSRWAPEIPGLADLVSDRIDQIALVDRFTSALAVSMGIEYVNGSSTELESAEKAAAAQFRTDLYANPAWTRRR